MKARVSEPIRLPTRAGEFDARYVVVVDDRGGIVREGVLLQSLMSVANDAPLLVRVQSSCLFSESFWATNCDCALQLRESLSAIAGEGGLVLYFYEEGRGAGLATKFRAIRLQQLLELDTARAYECLNLAPDSRSYAAAAIALIEVLSPHRPILLMTNNPEKADQLRELGVNVAERRPLICGWDKPEIRKYLIDKRKVLGHDIPDDLDQLGNTEHQQ